jgi:hypothetical protein
VGRESASERLSGFFRGVFQPVVGNDRIDDGSAVQTFPGVDDMEVIGKPLFHHQSLAASAFHRWEPPMTTDPRVVGKV